MNDTGSIANAIGNAIAFNGFESQALTQARENLKRLTKNVRFEDLPEIEAQLRTITYHLQYGTNRRGYKPHVPRPILSTLACHICGRGPRNDVGIYHVGDQWLCDKHLPKGTGFVVGEPSSQRNARLEEKKG